MGMTLGQSKLVGFLAETLRGGNVKGNGLMFCEPLAALMNGAANRGGSAAQIRMRASFYSFKVQFEKYFIDSDSTAQSVTRL
jgi:hypothetical protein